MKKETTNRVKLGLFVTTGLIFLIVGLYFIGNNKNIFGRTFLLYSKFSNIVGLQVGNNIRYSGIDVGTVEEISIQSDTSVIVEMRINLRLKNNIRKNSVANINTDGLMGNKLINIDPGTPESQLVSDGDTLLSRKGIDTDQMMRTLEVTNTNIAFISADLRNITGNLNKSRGTLYKVLMDSSLANSLHQTIENIHEVSNGLDQFTRSLNTAMQDMKGGKGVLGSLLADSSNISESVNSSLANFERTSQQLNEVSAQLDSIVSHISSGNGTIGALLKDTTMAGNLKRMMMNLDSSTVKLNENMEAMKHNFLTRGYFKDQEKAKKKEKK